jgi:hypothetical protein
MLTILALTRLPWHAGQTGQRSQKRRERRQSSYKRNDLTNVSASWVFNSLLKTISCLMASLSVSIINTFAL